MVFFGLARLNIIIHSVILMLEKRQLIIIVVCLDEIICCKKKLSRFKTAIKCNVAQTFYSKTLAHKVEE